MMTSYARIVEGGLHGHGFEIAITMTTDHKLLTAMSQSIGAKRSIHMGNDEQNLETRKNNR